MQNPSNVQSQEAPLAAPTTERPPGKTNTISQEKMFQLIGEEVCKTRQMIELANSLARENQELKVQIEMLKQQTKTPAGPISGPVFKPAVKPKKG